LKLRAIVGTEIAGVIGAAAGQREKVASPFTGRSDDIRSIEAHASIESSKVPDGVYAISGD
jgi:hypothetical protein